MNIFIETIKFIGSCLGIATALFIVFDRLYRDRPIFSLRVVSRQRGAENKLRIKNTTDEDLVIDGISFDPKYFTLAVDDGIRSSIVSSIRRRGEFDPIVVGPRGERLLRLIFTENHQQGASDSVAVVATWNNTRRPWPWKRHVRIRTSLTSINLLKSALAESRAPKQAEHQQ